MKRYKIYLVIVLICVSLLLGFYTRNIYTWVFQDYRHKILGSWLISEGVLVFDKEGRITKRSKYFGRYRFIDNDFLVYNARSDPRYSFPVDRYVKVKFPSGDKMIFYIDDRKWQIFQRVKR